MCRALNIALDNLPLREVSGLMCAYVGSGVVSVPKAIKGKLEVSVLNPENVLAFEIRNVGYVDPGHPMSSA
jgi:hypothetical protein